MITITEIILDRTFNHNRFIRWVLWMTLRKRNVLPFLLSPFLKCSNVINVVCFSGFLPSWVGYGSNGKRVRKTKNHSKAKNIPYKGRETNKYEASPLGMRSKSLLLNWLQSKDANANKSLTENALKGKWAFKIFARLSFLIGSIHYCQIWQGHMSIRSSPPGI